MRWDWPTFWACLIWGLIAGVLTGLLAVWLGI